jgi:uncharacterized protein (TIGR03435 family)
MKPVCRKTLHGFSARKLGLTAGFALCVGSAAAQCGTGVHPSGVQISETAINDIRFEVASIHPLNDRPESYRFVPTPTGYDSALTLAAFVKIAYAPERPMVALLGSGGVSKVQNLPNWASNWYQINARVADQDLAAWQGQGSECQLFKAALRNLLKERFHLAVHEENIQIPAYNLVAARKGPRLTASATTSEPAHDPRKGMTLAGGGIMANNPRDDGRTEWHFTYATMDDLAEFLGRLDLPVKNMTSLTGRYDFVLLGPDRGSWDYDNQINNWPIDHLGLELKPGKVQGLNIVVDHIEKPGEN